VAEVDLNDKTKFYFGRYKFNLKYSGINVDYVLHFLMQNDTKADGNSSPFKTYGSTEMPYCGGRKWLTLAMLPGNLNATLRTQWLPIFKLLEEKLATQSTETFEDDEDEIEQKYMRCLAHLKERVSYCWNKNKLDPAQFTLGTWSNKTSRSAILKHGNVTDKEKLSEPSNRNKVRPSSQSHLAACFPLFYVYGFCTLDQNHYTGSEL
jgi:hypothetical protein